MTSRVRAPNPARLLQEGALSHATLCAAERRLEACATRRKLPPRDARPAFRRVLPVARP